MLEDFTLPAYDTKNEHFLVLLLIIKQHLFSSESLENGKAPLQVYYCYYFPLCSSSLKGCVW